MEIGDISEEGGIHEVETGTDPAHLAAAEAQCRGMTQLVERGRDDDDAQQHQHQAGLVEQLVNATDRLYAVSSFLEHSLGSRIRNVLGLQTEQARNDLQVILDSVMNFL